MNKYDMVFDMSGVFRNGTSSYEIERFVYRGLTCFIRQFMEAVNGYVAGPLRVWSREEAYVLRNPAVNWTFYEEADGVVMLGFDTNQLFDGPYSQNPEYVRQKLVEAVDSLWAEGLVEGRALPPSAALNYDDETGAENGL